MMKNKKNKKKCLCAITIHCASWGSFTQVDAAPQSREGRNLTPVYTNLLLLMDLQRIENEDDRLLLPHLDGDESNKDLKDIL